MNKELKSIYQDVYNRGWTSQGYRGWRGSVIKRINKMYRTRYRNLTDIEILNYLNKAKFY